MGKEVYPGGQGGLSVQVTSELCPREGERGRDFETEVTAGAKSWGGRARPGG